MYGATLFYQSKMLFYGLMQSYNYILYLSTQRQLIIPMSVKTVLLIDRSGINEL